MKKTTAKILTAVVALVISLGIAAGTTFAWFTSNRTVTFDALEAEVTTGTQGLYVAVKRYGTETFTEFKPSIDNATLLNEMLGTESGGSRPTSIKLSDLTTDVPEDQNYKGVKLVEEGKSASQETTFTNGAENKFIEFTLKFRTTVQQDIYLAINNGNGISSGINYVDGNSLTTVKSWRRIEANEYGNNNVINQNEALSTRAAYAARVSFITDGVGKVWAPYDYALGSDDLSHTQAGFYVNTEEKNLARDFRNAILGRSDTYVCNVLNEVKLLSDALAAQNKNVSDDFGAVPATPIARTMDNSEGAFDAVVTVRLWIEGTDGDCLNSIFNDKISLQLVFNSILVA